MSKLLNADYALAQILEHIHPLKTETIPIEQALYRVLAQDVIAPLNLPPFANSSMDGFAVRSKDTQPAPQKLTVVEDIPAGHFSKIELQEGQAARIMTGAPIPKGADSIVPIEETDVAWGVEEPIHGQPEITITKSAKAGNNVRPIGESVKQGDCVLSAQTQLYASDIGILASMGIHEVLVYRKPKAIIISTGDELLPISAPLTAGKIYDANSYSIAALVTQHGGEAIPLPPVRDSVAEVEALFEQALTHQPDLIISSAGVSVGTFDVVRTVIEKMGSIGFWRVNVRPGKPLAFGNIQDIPFFGLPGNPVSAMVTFDIFVRPALQKLSQIPDKANFVTAITGEDLSSDGRRTYVRVRLEKENNQYIAYETGTQSSGALISMVKADALLIIPEGEKRVPKGTELPARLLRH